MPERISGVAELSSKSRLQILRNREYCHSGNEALIRCSIEGLETVILDVGDGDVKTIGDSYGQVVEDLVTTILGGHEGVVQGPLETDLAHEAILGDFAWNTTGGSDHLRQTGSNASTCSSWRRDR